MGLTLQSIDGQTPLDEEGKEGLLIKSIATRAELDEFEQQNIEQAMAWTLNRSFKKEAILTELFIRRVHKQMYGDVWNWAGAFRKANKNIGIDKWQIPTELRYLLDDTRHWMEKNTYDPIEIAVRFKHRLVSIHCFANGNGRHSRLLADIIVQHIFKKPVLTWGAATFVKQGDTRMAYLKAIKAADAGNLAALIKFARS
jgi:Fic-DOC domain mobile mystery protein B